MDFELIEKALPILLLGAGVTIEITAVSVFIGFCIGLFCRYRAYLQGEGAAHTGCDLCRLYPWYAASGTDLPDLFCSADRDGASRGAIRGGRRCLRDQ